MKLLEIPENTSELRDYNHFIKVISEVQEFNKNIKQFLEKVLFDEFYKTVGDWRKIIKPEDHKKIDVLFADATTSSKFQVSEIKTQIKSLKIDINNKKRAIKKYCKDWGERDTQIEQENLDDLIFELNELETELYCEQNTSKYDDVYIFYCYETNQFIKPKHNKAGHYWNKVTPKCISEIKPSEDGLKIEIEFYRSYKHSSSPGWLPTYHASLEFEIDLLTKSVTENFEQFRETSNKY